MEFSWLSWFQFRTDEPVANANGEHAGKRCKCGRGWAFGKDGKCFTCTKEEKRSASPPPRSIICDECDPREKLWSISGQSFAPLHTKSFSPCLCAECGHLALVPNGQPAKDVPDKVREQKPSGNSPSKKKFTKGKSKPKAPPPAPAPPPPAPIKVATPPVTPPRKLKKVKRSPESTPRPKSSGGVVRTRVDTSPKRSLGIGHIGLRNPVGELTAVDIDERAELAARLEVEQLKVEELKAEEEAAKRATEEAATRQRAAAREVERIKAGVAAAERAAAEAAAEAEAEAQAQAAAAAEAEKAVAEEAAITKLQAACRGHLARSHMLPAAEPEPSHEEVVAALTQAFHAVDVDHSGALDIDELRELMKVLGESSTDAELELMIKTADTDGNGTIELDEFIEAMT